VDQQVLALADPLAGSEAGELSAYAVDAGAVSETTSLDNLSGLIRGGNLKNIPGEIDG
jgi:hypothetical protein